MPFRILPMEINNCCVAPVAVVKTFFTRASLTWCWRWPYIVTFGDIFNFRSHKLRVDTLWVIYEHIQYICIYTAQTYMTAFCKYWPTAFVVSNNPYIYHLMVRKSEKDMITRVWNTFRRMRELFELNWFNLTCNPKYTKTIMVLISKACTE